jgi:hypothetical protein
MRPVIIKNKNCSGIGTNRFTALSDIPREDISQIIIENLVRDESVGTDISLNISKKRTLVCVRMVCLSFGNEARPQNIIRSGDRTQGGNKIGVIDFLENTPLGQ